jgi:ATP-dependent Zn protease
MSAFLEQVNSLSNSSSTFPTLLVTTTTSSRTLSAYIQEGFLHTIDINTPDEVQRALMLQFLFKNDDLRRDVNLKTIAQRTAVSFAYLEPKIH